MIRRGDLDDSGVFVCLARNRFGTANKTFHLLVQVVTSLFFTFQAKKLGMCLPPPGPLMMRLELGDIFSKPFICLSRLSHLVSLHSKGIYTPGPLMTRLELCDIFSKIILFKTWNCFKKGRGGRGGL